MRASKRLNLSFQPDEILVQDGSRRAAERIFPLTRSGAKTLDTRANFLHNIRQLLMKTPTSLHPDTVLVRTREIQFDQFDEEYYAVDSKAGFFYNLNATGNRIWALLETPHSINALCAQLRQEYRIDAETCLRQVTETVTKMRDAGLVQEKTVGA